MRATKSTGGALFSKAATCRVTAEVHFHLYLHAVGDMSAWARVSGRASRDRTGLAGGNGCIAQAQKIPPGGNPSVVKPPESGRLESHGNLKPVESFTCPLQQAEVACSVRFLALSNP